MKSFVLSEGIRQYIFQRANTIGVRGFVRRVSRQQLLIRAEGTLQQLESLQLVLDELEKRTVIERMEIQEEVPIGPHLLSRDFKIERNERKHCEINPNSNGDEWENRTASSRSDLEAARFS